MRFVRGLRAPLRRGYATSSAPLSKTGLYDFHLEHSAKMVPFAGYSMPLSYGDVGQVAAHNHVRAHAGLFDVSHMVQSNFTGPSAQKFLEWLTPSSLSALKPYSSTLSVLLNEKGGIIDDTVITKHSDDSFYVVTNAGRRERDLAWFAEKLEEWRKERGGGVDMEVLDGWGLVALQGPESAKHLQTLTTTDLSTLTFGKSAFVPMKGGWKVHVARGGYTGEDGFEISLPPTAAVPFTQALVSASPSIQLTGLGARDSLRLEAGMCLYGQDLDEDTSLVEAGLGWVVGKGRKDPPPSPEGDFIGAGLTREHFANGPPRRRVGLIVQGAPARQHAKIFTSDPESNDIIGEVTSGIPSPTLGMKNIAMGYVSTLQGMHKKGTKVGVEVRGKRMVGEVVGMPFVPTRYYRG